jgi:signal transduction histidine kinase
MVADMVQRKPYLEDRDRDDLVEVRETALKMVDAVRDIVWYIDPEHDSLDATVMRMQGVAATMLRGTEHEFHVNLPSRSITLQMATRRVLFLVFKEALHNVVRHALAGRVMIGLEFAGGRLCLTVKDDGIGFDPEGVADGHGLRSMRRRASEIGAELEIRSRPQGGTTIELSINLASSRDGGNGD